MDFDARTDFFFTTILCAISLFDPNHAGLLDPEAISYEQSCFYSILRKLVITQSNLQSEMSPSILECGNGLKVSAKSILLNRIAHQLECNVFPRIKIIQSEFENLVFVQGSKEQLMECQ